MIAPKEYYLQVTKAAILEAGKELGVRVANVKVIKESIKNARPLMLEAQIIRQNISISGILDEHLASLAIHAAFEPEELESQMLINSTLYYKKRYEERLTGFISLLKQAVELRRTCKAFERQN